MGNETYPAMQLGKSTAATSQEAGKADIDKRKKDVCLGTDPVEGRHRRHLVEKLEHIGGPVPAQQRDVPGKDQDRRRGHTPRVRPGPQDRKRSRSWPITSIRAHRTTIKEKEWKGKEKSGPGAGRRLTKAGTVVRRDQRDRPGL